MRSGPTILTFALIIFILASGAALTLLYVFVG